MYKYALANSRNINGPQLGLYEIELPKGAKPLHIGLDGESQLCIWAMVNPEEKKTEGFQYRRLGTGWDLPPEATLDKHWCSVNVFGLIWHFFHA